MIARHGNTTKNIYVIDFGLALKWHRKREMVDTMMTYQFSSINACLGYRPSRAEDIESLIYVMVHLFNKVTFPWKLEIYFKIIAEKKKKISSSKLIKGMPKAFKYIHEDLKRLRYQEKPD